MMGCAGCEDCDNTAWHLHVTVDREDRTNTGLWRGTSLDVDCARIGAKPVRVTNVIWPWGGDSYEEIIPTLSVRGTEERATADLISFCAQLLRWDYKILRAKIEGAPTLARPERALYWETHVKYDHVVGVRASLECAKIPVSMVRGSREDVLIATLRGSREEILAAAARLPCQQHILEKPRLEACVLDTNRGMDSRWLGQ